MDINEKADNQVDVNVIQDELNLNLITQYGKNVTNLLSVTSILLVLSVIFIIFYIAITMMHQNIKAFCKPKKHIIFLEFFCIHMVTKWVERAKTETDMNKNNFFLYLFVYPCASAEQFC